MRRAKDFMVGIVLFCGVLALVGMALLEILGRLPK